MHFLSRRREDIYRLNPAIFTGGGGAAQVRALNPAAWFRLGRGITQAGGFASQWDDQSGNGRHLKQTTGAAQPSVNANGSLLLNGTTQFMKTDPFTLNQPETIYLLFKDLVWTNSARIWDGNLAATGAVLQLNVSPQLLYNAGSSIGPVSLTIGALCVISVVANGASSSIQINSAAPVTGDAGAVNMGGFTLGGAGGGTNFSNIEAWEAIIFPTAHNATQKAQVIRYLNSVGGL